MATVNLVGDSGKVSFAAGVISSVTTWSIDVTADTAESTAMNGGGWKTHLGSLKSWSGSCEVNINLDDVAGTDLSAAEIPIGTTGAGEFFADGSGALTATYSGDVIVTGYSVSSAIGSVVTASVTFQGSGTLTGV